jgi:hypothetical protein
MMDIQKLKELQAVENEGRGINCVRFILTLLNTHQVDKAKIAYQNEGDKICSYPLVQQWFYENLGCRIHLKKDCQSSLCIALKEYNDSKVERKNHR